jgi:hypothetical protein
VDDPHTPGAAVRPCPLGPTGKRRRDSSHNPQADETGGGSPRAVIGRQIEELGHEPRAEGHVGENDVERDASCIPMEQTTEPLVGNDPAGERLDYAYNGVKTFRLL